MKRENLIYDIGMHKGEDTRHYLQKGYQVLAVEADPLLAEKCKQTFSKYISKGQLTILNVGIAEKEAVLPFYKNLRLTEWSSFNSELGTRNNTKCEVVNVQCGTTGSLFAKYGVPFYLKIDIEGSDYLCVQAIAGGTNLVIYPVRPQISIFWNC